MDVKSGGFLLYENIQFSHARSIKIGHRMEFFPSVDSILKRILNFMDRIVSVNSDKVDKDVREIYYIRFWKILLTKFSNSGIV